MTGKEELRKLLKECRRGQVLLSVLLVVGLVGMLMSERMPILVLLGFAGLAVIVNLLSHTLNQNEKLKEFRVSTGRAVVEVLGTSLALLMVGIAKYNSEAGLNSGFVIFVILVGYSVNGLLTVYHAKKGIERALETE